MVGTRPTAYATRDDVFGERYETLRNFITCTMERNNYGFPSSLIFAVQSKHNKNKSTGKARTST